MCTLHSPRFLNTQLNNVKYNGTNTLSVVPTLHIMMQLRYVMQHRETIGKQISPRFDVTESAS